MTVMNRELGTARMGGKNSQSQPGGKNSQSQPSAPTPYMPQIIDDPAKRQHFMPYEPSAPTPYEPQIPRGPYRQAQRPDGMENRYVPPRSMPDRQGQPFRRPYDTNSPEPKNSQSRVGGKNSGLGGKNSRIGSIISRSSPLKEKLGGKSGSSEVPRYSGPSHNNPVGLPLTPTKPLIGE